jgi:flavin-dependent dehydrogenase
VDADAIILGAGPAGATAALNLAPFRKVLLVDPAARAELRIGESIPGAARRLLADMGLLDQFLSDGHAPRYALRSAWGGAIPTMRDSIADPDGHGWQIDRRLFEDRLRTAAGERGALPVTARAVAVRRLPDRHAVTLDNSVDVAARLVIDASGRRSRLLAMPRARRGKLGCAWLRASGVALPAGIVQIEAEIDGWWYCSALPAGEGILAFHTDADLPAAKAVATPGALLRRARGLPMLGPLLQKPAWDISEISYCAAHSAWPESPVQDGWIATGDAALACDPLSAQGLLNALYFGLSAAEAAHRWLDGDAAALGDYARDVASVRSRYLTAETTWYGLERRWPDSAFWKRRHET